MLTWLMWLTNAYRAGDDRPSILRTADLGQDLAIVTGDLPANDPVEVVREDPVNPKLLYAGTHFGVFASFDQGAHWVRIRRCSSVRVDDFQIHPRTSDLVIATHGRSIAIIDDSVPFREFTPEIALEAGTSVQRRSGYSADICNRDLPTRTGKAFIAEKTRRKAHFHGLGERVYRRRNQDRGYQMPAANRWRI